MSFNDAKRKPGKKIDDVARRIATIQSSYTHPYRSKRILEYVNRVWLRLKRANSPSRQEYWNKSETRKSIMKLRPKLKYNTYRSKQHYHSPFTENGKMLIPEKNVLIFERSSCFWSAGCIALNSSCQSICQNILETPVLSFQDAEREKMRFDLFGIYNCLDHYIEPLDVLQKAVGLSKLVLVENHQNDAMKAYSKQHLFSIGRHFLKHVADEGWSWIDLSELLADPLQNYYLISSQINLQSLNIEEMFGREY